METLLDRSIAAFSFQAELGGHRCLPSRLVGTGALINSSVGDRTPLFLTARHHFLFGGDGVRLGFYPSFEAIWDYTEAATEGASQTEVLARLPKSRGATLLACDSATDSALLLLEEVPPGRTFLGWCASPVEQGEFQRLSHPYGCPQTCAHHMGLEPFVCAADSTVLSSPDRTGLPSHRFYQTRFEGSLGPGSSGAPLLTSDLRVVGQLWGVFERGGVAYALDGAFVYAYRQVRQWLDPLGKGKASATSAD